MTKNSVTPKSDGHTGQGQRNFTVLILAQGLQFSNPLYMAELTVSNIIFKLEFPPTITSFASTPNKLPKNWRISGNPSTTLCGSHRLLQRCNQMWNSKYPSSAWKDPIVPDRVCLWTYLNLILRFVCIIFCL